ncbi:hypothetical protein AAFF_G00139660 [Aldrovandia affinis]|uniref:Uncharacterized protein n=1 Tax=Aldrovandia affinis TaxID=143900 RepID=A0AAD7X2P3_9TELE|nr:hypothetical protein AAFF_G00139660 [Aldrovandia affinis]
MSRVRHQNSCALTDFGQITQIAPSLLSSLPPLSLVVCQSLWRERDGAVGDLAEALRDLEDVRKRKLEALEEPREMKKEQI